MELTILMPCLNEAETIEGCVSRAIGFITKANLEGEVVVADNGSTDGSQAIAMNAGARVVHVEERGYGAAIMGGVRAARGKYIIMGDADGSYDFDNLEPFVEKLREGFQLVMGNRFRGGIAPGAMPALHRYLGNPVLSALGRMFFRLPIGDFHCGLRGFSRRAMLDLSLATGGMEFASEMIVKSGFAGYRIAEVPTTLSPDGRSRPPHLRTWRDGWRHLRFLLIHSPRWLFLYPGIALLAGSLAAMCLLVAGPVSIGGVTFDIHTLLYSAGGLQLGTQMVFFAMLARTYGVVSGLLPRSRYIDWFMGVFSLEIGIAFGLLLLALGFGIAVHSVVEWKRAGLSAADPAQMMRLVIPSVSCLVLGGQLIFNSFFVAILSAGMTSPISLQESPNANEAN